MDSHHQMVICCLREASTVNAISTSFESASCVHSLVCTQIRINTRCVEDEVLLAACCHLVSTGLSLEGTEAVRSAKSRSWNPQKHVASVRFYGSCYSMFHSGGMLGLNSGSILIYMNLTIQMGWSASSKSREGRCTSI